MNTKQAIVAIIAQDHIQQKPEFPLIMAKLMMNDLKRLMGDHMSIEKVVNDIRKGKSKAAGSLIGPIMRATQGKANPKEITERILKLANN
jgi:Asp-tRNA(Asn)/Glu-tRNA(Gln) amidotransferase B subunit